MCDLSNEVVVGLGLLRYEPMQQTVLGSAWEFLEGWHQRTGYLLSDSFAHRFHLLSRPISVSTTATTFTQFLCQNEAAMAFLWGMVIIEAACWSVVCCIDKCLCFYSLLVSVCGCLSVAMFPFVLGDRWLQQLQSTMKVQKYWHVVCHRDLERFIDKLCFGFLCCCFHRIVPKGDTDLMLCWICPVQSKIISMRQSIILCYIIATTLTYLVLTLLCLWRDLLSHKLNSVTDIATTIVSTSTSKW